jgi:uncharacterized membrane protein
MSIPDKSDRVLAACAYIPSGLIPLLILAGHHKSKFVRVHAAEAFNLYIYLIALCIVTTILNPTPDPLPAVIVVSVFLLLLIHPAVGAIRGHIFRYPLPFRLLK